MGDYLYLVSHLYGIQIHQFVLMSNHFHLVVSALNANISPAMAYFMRETSREITRLSGRINQTYGGRHHKTLLTTPHYLMNTYKYVYRNPARAGLCEFVEAYPYSTLNGLLGLSHLTIPVLEDPMLFTPNLNESHLRWLNIASKPEHEDEMRKALRRREFKLPKTKTRRPSDLETILI